MDNGEDDELGDNLGAHRRHVVLNWWNDLLMNQSWESTSQLSQGITRNTVGMIVERGGKLCRSVVFQMRRSYNARHELHHRHDNMGCMCKAEGDYYSRRGSVWETKRIAWIDKKSSEVDLLVKRIVVIHAGYASNKVMQLSHYNFRNFDIFGILLDTRGLLIKIW